MLTRIYCPKSYTTGDIVQLETQASHHLLKVLRKKPGDSIILFNGRNGEFDAIILPLTVKDQVKVQVGCYHDRNSESLLNIHLVYGLARFEKTEWVIQKAVELGVNRITPVMTQHGEIHLPPAAIPARLARWNSIAIAASEQAGRCFIPKIEMPLKFKDWIGQYQEEDETRWIFHLEGGVLLSDQSVPHLKKVTLLVGSEGGFCEEEVKQAMTQGFKIASLGPRVLRTETAAIAVIAIVQSLWGDL